MTSTEVQEMNIETACRVAGLGGTIQRNVEPYEVFQGREAGTFRLSRDGGPTEPTSTYMSGGWHVISKTEESASKVTVLEFFSSMTHGTYVYRSDTDELPLIFVGMHWEDSDYKFANLVNGRWANVVQLRVDDENTWQTREDENGDLLSATQNERSLATAVVNQRESLNKYDSSMSEKIAENEALRADFVQLNEFLCKYAEDEGMCGQFESTIFDWNNSFVGPLKLYGRLRSQNVAITIGDLTSGIAKWMNVEARSPEQAKEIVEAMSPNDILRKLMDEGYEFDSMPMKIRTQNEFYAETE